MAGRSRGESGQEGSQEWLCDGVGFRSERQSRSCQPRRHCRDGRRRCAGPLRCGCYLAADAEPDGVRATNGGNCAAGQRPARSSCRCTRGRRTCCQCTRGRCTGGQCTCGRCTGCQCTCGQCSGCQCTCGQRLSGRPRYQRLSCCRRSHPPRSGRAVSRVSGTPSHRPPAGQQPLLFHSRHAADSPSGSRRYAPWATGGP